MTKKVNTGFGMVEILIAVAVFTILMIPIVSGLISSIKLTSSSKELQYRNDFAENLMEHVKSVDLDEVCDADYYTANGTTDFSSSYTPGTKMDSYNKEFEYGTYKITGKTKLGLKDQVYSYCIQLDNNYYVDKDVNSDDYVDPNNLAMGVVEDIDHRKVALIDGSVLNYDAVASDAFNAKKLMELKIRDPEGYKQQMENDTNLFANDKAYRLMTVEISGDKTNGYLVRCILDYIDTSSYLSSDNHIQYVPYAATFKDKLPNIYVMYDPCFYNMNYSDSDYITIDTKDLDMADLETVDLFIVETASTYSRNITDANAVAESEKGKDLIHTSVTNAGTREKVKVHLSATTGNTVSDMSFLNKLHIYYNFGDNTELGGFAKPNLKTIEENLFYKEDDAKPVIDTWLSSMQTLINNSNGLTNKIKFVPLVPKNASEPSATVGLLNTATDENRSLYEVKIWIQQGDSVDTTVDPILQGTKGGNET